MWQQILVQVIIALITKWLEERPQDETTAAVVNKVAAATTPAEFKEIANSPEVGKLAAEAITNVVDSVGGIEGIFKAIVDAISGKKE